ncbi:MAG: gamma carbonic anhydrase family protein [Acidobacteriota bacterium]
MIYAYIGTRPAVDPTCFVAPGARIIGDVHVGADSSVWFNTVIRGDVQPVRIGQFTNIQDGCILHVATHDGPLDIGDYVTLGHGVIAQGSQIRSHVLVGMGAVILDYCTIEEHSVVAAGSVLVEGTHVPSGVLVAGAPARTKRDLTEAEKEAIRTLAMQYVGLKNQYLQGGFAEVTET